MKKTKSYNEIPQKIRIIIWSYLPAQQFYENSCETPVFRLDTSKVMKKYLDELKMQKYKKEKNLWEILQKAYTNNLNNLFDIFHYFISIFQFVIKNR